MFLNLEPGDFVINSQCRDWSLEQIQSIIREEITVNFENVGKKVINSKIVILEKVNNIE